MSLLELDNSRDFRGSNAIRGTADLMVRNVERLVGIGMIDWDFVLDEIREETSFYHDSLYFPAKGKGAVARHIGIPIASLLSMLELSPHSPQAVYLSADYFVSSLGVRINFERAKLNEIESGVRTFTTDEFRIKAVEKSGQKVEKLEVQQAVIKEAIERLAQENFPEPLLYARVLHHLLFALRHNKHTQLRFQVIRLLKDEKVVEAYNRCFPAESI